MITVGNLIIFYMTILKYPNLQIMTIIKIDSSFFSSKYNFQNRKQIPVGHAKW